MLGLSGVVVNDSLVLVDYINRKRCEGTPLLNAVRTAGVARFRAIMLTSFTTFARADSHHVEKKHPSPIFDSHGYFTGLGHSFHSVHYPADGPEQLPPFGRWHTAREKIPSLTIQPFLAKSPSTALTWLAHHTFSNPSSDHAPTAHPDQPLNQC